MDAKQLKNKYLDFFVDKGHKVLPNLSLVPENDPTTLFISAGMQPMVPYLLGETHPLGKRLVSLQRCLRTVDIDEVGDVSHNTFFEMLGNWSLGDPASPDGVGQGGYWKDESLSWSYQFLTKILGLDSNKLHVTIFAGDKNAPRDNESEKIWLSLGIPKDRIYPLPRVDNWWEAGNTGPGGPDSEIFYDIGKPACGPGCRPGDNCGRFFEMWNNVFMEYNRKADGTYERLKQKNVDTGFGVERTSVVLQGKDNIYQTDVFQPIIAVVEKISGKNCAGDYQKPIRIIADHLRAATSLIGDGVVPENVDQGYILRRLIRRAVRCGRPLGIDKPFVSQVAKIVIDNCSDDYSFLRKNSENILRLLDQEEQRFSQALDRGLKEFEKAVASLGISQKKISGETAYRLYESYGFPQELTEELAQERGLVIDQNGFVKAELAHQKQSQSSTNRKFKGGLADQSEATTKLHTATHLLHQAIGETLGKVVPQVGSNITSERLRFDFPHLKKLDEKQRGQIEELVNSKIGADLPVKMTIMSFEEAKKKGIMAFFEERYGDKVKVYSIGDYSKEVCGGPHVSSTGELGHFKIIKIESTGSNRQRIYAVLN